MKMSEAIKPISYLKANASRIVREISEEHKTMIITQNGKAKVVVQDLESYEETQESLALLKILAQSTKQKKEGNFKSAKDTFAEIRKEIAE